MLIISFVIAQVLVTSFLTGLIWYVQIVHYPLLNYVSVEDFGKYHRQQVRLTSYVVVPSMLLEAICVGGLVFLFPRGTQLYFLTMTGLIALGLIWLSTFALQVPRHLRLKLGHHAESIRALIRMNWIRTILWSFRLFISVITLIKLFD